MISIEAARDGFVILVNGERTIIHSRRSPCLSIGTAELSMRKVRGSAVARARRASWTPLRDFTVVENRGDRTTIDFSGRIRMSFCREDELLRLTFSRYDPAVRLFRLEFQAFPEEAIYGGGERRSRLDLKGRRIPLWVEEGSTLREGERGLLAAEFRARSPKGSGGSFALPVFVSSRHYWCAVVADAHTVLDFRRRQTSAVECWEVPREIIVGRRSAAADVARDLAGILGRQPPLPAWAHDGAWIGMDLSSGAADLGARVDELLSGGVKIGAVWSQGYQGRDGRKRRPLWDLAGGSADALSGELRAEALRLRARGIRLLGHADPWLDPDGPLFAEARESGFLVRNDRGETCLVPTAGGQFAIVDLSDRKASAWLAGIMAHDLARTGAAGWMADSGGLLPADAALASREEALAAHNRWPRLWAETCAAALAQAGREGESLFAMRSGWIGISGVLPLAWSGGRAASFDAEAGLASVVPAALSLGLSGIGSFHTEVGGCLPGPRGERGRECVGRWMELAAFSPVFRIRENPQAEARGEVREPGALAVDKELLPLLARMTEIHAALKPYHVSVADEYQRKGLPAIRHPSVEYGGEPELHGRDYQYLYGRDLLVAPTLEPGRELTELRLPEDEWVHLWSSRRFRGGLVTVESPSGCPAVFYRSGSSFAQLFDSIRRTARKV